MCPMGEGISFDGGGFRKKLWDGGEGVVHPPHAPYYGKPWKGGILEKGGVWVDLKKGVWPPLPTMLRLPTKWQHKMTSHVNISQIMF